MAIKHLSLLFVNFEYCQYNNALANFIVSAIVVIINVVLQLMILIHLPQKLTLFKQFSLIVPSWKSNHSKAYVLINLHLKMSLNKKSDVIISQLHKCLIDK